jgi:hypothetical protein
LEPWEEESLVCLCALSFQYALLYKHISFVISTWIEISFVLFNYFSMILHRWISVGSDLKFDARRDLDDVGASCIDGMFFGLLNCQTLRIMKGH